MPKRNVAVNFNGKRFSSTLAEDWKEKFKKKVAGSRNSLSSKFTTSWKNAKERRGAESIIKAVGHIQSSERYKAMNARLSCQIKKLSLEAEEESFWKTVASECFGSLFFMVLAGGTTFQVGVHNAVIATALCSGFCQIALMFCFAKEGHFNSSISIGLTWAGLVKKRDTFIRIICHFFGNFFGSLILNRLSSSSSHYIGVSSLNSGVSRSKAFLGEFLATLIFAFVFIICYKKHKSGGHFITGAILTAILLFIIPYTGGCLNPSRSLASALASNFWSNQWIFLSATTLGGMLAGCLHKLMTTNVILKSFDTFYVFLKRRKQVTPKSESHSVDEVLSSKMSTFSDILEMSSPKYAVKTTELYADESDLESSDEEFSPWDAMPTSMKFKCANKTVHWNPNVVEVTGGTEHEEFIEDLSDIPKGNFEENILKADSYEPATDSGTLTMFGNIKEASLHVDGNDVIIVGQSVHV